jgi:phosphoglycerate dehydrogenase-like enzyme
MHIHIHNDITTIDLPIDAQTWAAAEIEGHHVTFGDTPAHFADVADSVELLITPPWVLKRLDLHSAPKLRVIQSTSAGVDALQPFDHIPAHVEIWNNRGTHAEKAGEYALMAILMLVNLIPRFASYQRREHWSRDTATLARHARLTIVGLGSLGGAAARQARHLGMTITGIRAGDTPHEHCDRTLTLAALDEVLPETDILLLACPLTPATRNLLTRARIAALPQGAGVINIGRGPLIEEEALFDALESEHLSGAVLDVFVQEPLRPGARAYGVKNLIITPHMSSDDPRTYNKLTLNIFKNNLESHLANRPAPTRVDRVKGY